MHTTVQEKLATPTLQEQVEKVRLAMMREFGYGEHKKRKPEYDPEKLLQFCKKKWSSNIVFYTAQRNASGQA